MKKFKIEKYINQELDETYTIPVAFISILTTILPASAIESLTQAGFDFKTLIEASKQDLAYQSSAMVEEKGISKKIIITLLP
ncbi:DUF2868 domain-containing protein [Zophobihabitans entericus]|uniref:DUF2868 domain-containing protein n=1 Tax=Zophobihabitans entericus TaxID=1635327 RepID=A0A6G9IEE4_9GAMM|nr:DUF2868 domain-containing protein [Zophobihabitans entericus]QIQ22197.1 DUF2868 domain-containing protein [Zophobihabitans entericus]